MWSGKKKCQHNGKRNGENTRPAKQGNKDLSTESTFLVSSEIIAKGKTKVNGQ